MLGNLPILGAAFRSTSDTVERQEVMVLLTPHILDELDEKVGLRAQEDIDRSMAGAKESLMPIDRVRLVEDNYTKAARFYLEGNKEQSLRHLRIAPVHAADVSGGHPAQGADPVRKCAGRIPEAAADRFGGSRRPDGGRELRGFGG